MVGFTSQTPTPNPDEIEAIRWLDWSAWLTEVVTKPDEYSPWAVEETKLLQKSEGFNELFAPGCNIINELA